MQATKCREFSRDYDHDAFSVVRVFNNRLAALGGRNAWVTITSEKSQIYRRARGLSSVGMTQDAIELDYDSRDELGINGQADSNGFYACKVTIEKSTLRERLKGHWSNPNPAYTVPYRLAVLSVMLGLVGLFLGILSLVK